MKDELKKVEGLESSLNAPWSQTGESAEDYVKRVTVALSQVSELLEGRTTDTSMVQSAIKDTADLMVYATARKELLALKSLMLSHIARENRYGPNDTKRSNKGS